MMKYVLTMAPTYPRWDWRQFMSVKGPRNNCTNEVPVTSHWTINDIKNGRFDLAK